MSERKHAGWSLGRRTQERHAPDGWNPSRDTEEHEDGSKSRPDRGTAGVVRVRGTGRGDRK